MVNGFPVAIIRNKKYQENYSFLVKAFFRPMMIKMVATIMIIAFPNIPINPKLILAIVLPKMRIRIINPITNAIR
jgi:hypothetical protein